MHHDVGYGRGANSCTMMWVTPELCASASSHETTPTELKTYIFARFTLRMRDSGTCAITVNCLRAAIIASRNGCSAERMVL